MTNQEIVEMQRTFRQLQVRSQTIVADLRSENRDLSTEAAEIIEWLITRLADLRRELNEEILEGQRAERDAYFQGQWDEVKRNRGL